MNCSTRTRRRTSPTGGGSARRDGWSGSALPLRGLRCRKSLPGCWSPMQAAAWRGSGFAPRAALPLEPREVRVAVEAAGLNFLDLFQALGVVDGGLLGKEFCGRVLETGADVTGVSVGERVVGLGFGTFAPSVGHARRAGLRPLRRESRRQPSRRYRPCSCPRRCRSISRGWTPATACSSHSGAGGVGLAAIQLAQAAGAEVFATARAPPSRRTSARWACSTYSTAARRSSGRRYSTPPAARAFTWW